MDVGGILTEAWGAPFVPPPHPAGLVGIVMYAVGVGKAVEEELRQIASEPAELHVSYSPDFDTMTHLLDNLRGSICPGERIRLHSVPSLLSNPNPLVELEPGVGLSRQSPVTPSGVPGPAAERSPGGSLALHFQSSPAPMNPILYFNKTLG